MGWILKSNGPLEKKMLKDFAAQIEYLLLDRSFQYMLFLFIYLFREKEGRWGGTEGWDRENLILNRLHTQHESSVGHDLTTPRS